MQFTPAELDGVYIIELQPALVTVREANLSKGGGHCPWATVPQNITEHRHALDFKESCHLRIAANGTFLPYYVTCLVSVFFTLWFSFGAVTREVNLP